MALHGFLGLPSDWDEILDASWTKPAWLDLLAHIPDAQALPALADRLNSPGSADFNPHSVPGLQSGSMLLGYSMGGRIALHMLLQAPNRWSKAIIVSASPGPSRTEDRSARLQSDRRWAERFRTEPWEDLLCAWNAQPVFAGDPMDRREGDFDREVLAQALVRGSVAGQVDLREGLRDLDVPVLWIAGERDAKYRALAEACAALNPRFRCEILPNAGHRAPWTAPEAFRAALKSFLEE